MDLVSREEVLKTLWGIAPIKDGNSLSVQQVEYIFDSIKDRINALPCREYDDVKAFKLRLLKFIVEDEVE